MTWITGMPGIGMIAASVQAATVWHFMLRRSMPQPNREDRRSRQRFNPARGLAMTIRIPSLLAVSAIAALSLGVVACSEAEQDKTAAEADAAGDNTQAATAEAGSALKEEAAQVGSAVAAGAREAGQEIDEATDALAREAEEQKAETAADTRGNTPATQPATPLAH